MDDVRKRTVHYDVAYMAKLKTGQSLTDEEACELYDFSRFLYDAWSKKHYDFCKDATTGQATPEQNKFAGCYLSKLAIIANIAGTGKKTPEEVVLFFLEKLKRES